MKNMLFVFNPKSGRGQISNNLASIIDVFVKGGYEVVVHPSQHKDDIKDVICQKGEKFDTVVVAGGDGTLNEAVNALMTIDGENRPKLGYIPSGTTNDFAQSNNIPKNNVKKAAQTVVDGNVYSVDTGKFNDKYFSYIAAFGAFANVPYDTNQQAKNIFGYTAYILEGIKSLPGIKPHDVKIEYDGNTIEGSFIFGAVSNSFFVGGVKYTGVDISLNDGYFECILVKNQTNPIEFQLAIADLLTNNIKSDKFIVFKAKNIKFTFVNEVEWTLDGEFGGKIKKANIKNIKKAIEIITKQ